MAQLPSTDLLTDLAYQAIWAARFVWRREDLLREWEQWVQARVQEQSAGNGSSGHHSVRRLRNPTSREWEEAAAPGLPLVIEGALAGTRAVETWTLDWLRERCGSSTVAVMHDRAAAQGYEARHYDVGSTGFMRMADLVDAVRGGEAVFAAASANVFADHPELVDDLDLDRIEALFGRQVRRCEVFVAGPRTTTYYHCATAGNLFCQIEGRKRWILVAPWHSKWMYPNIGFSRKGIYFASPVVTAAQERDPDRYPLYNHVPKYVADLQPGDVLYNPPWWWHEVSNLDETIGVPLRLQEIGKSFAMNPLFNTLFFCTPTLWSESWSLIKGELSWPTGRVMALRDPADPMTPRPSD